MPVTNFKHGTRLYNLAMRHNRGLDRDKDGIACETGNTNPAKPVDDFYVQFNGDLCAYPIPGGSFSMRFTDSNTNFVDDGQGGKVPGRHLRTDDPGGNRDL